MHLSIRRRAELDSHQAGLETDALNMMGTFWEERIGYGALSVFWPGGRRVGMTIENVLDRWGPSYSYTPEPTTGTAFTLSFSGGEGDDLPPPGTPVIASPEIMAHAWPYSLPVDPCYRAESGRWSISWTPTAIYSGEGALYTIAPVGPRALLGDGQSPRLSILERFHSPATVMLWLVPEPYQTYQLGLANYRLDLVFAGLGQSGAARVYGPGGLIAEEVLNHISLLTSHPSSWPGVNHGVWHLLIYATIADGTLTVSFSDPYHTRTMTASAADLEVSSGPAYWLGGEPAGSPLRFNYFQIETL